MMLRAKLEEGLAALGQDLPPETADRLLAYLALLGKWNKVHNLTAVRQPEDMVILHLLDSLAVLPHLRGPRLLDVGTGGGLPGIPLALARPGWQVTLLDSNRKKTTFLRQAKAELGLDNVSILAGRVEEQEGAYDQVISRAFSEIGTFVGLAGKLCAPGGQMVAMKGVYPREELQRLPEGWRVREAIPLRVPGLEAERNLIIMERV
jgi:16S rRNA (guanine527-N7)-methyltransferase